MKTTLFYLPFFLICLTTHAQQLDSTFGVNGMVTSDFGMANELAKAVLLQPDGKILTAGSIRDTTGHQSFLLARYLTDGRLDMSFGANGWVSTHFRDSLEASGINEIALQDDGKIVALGYSSFQFRQQLAIARYHPDGSMDTTFADQGKFLLSDSVSNPNDRQTSYGNGLAIQADGKIVAGGYVGYYSFFWDDNTTTAVLMRLNTDGSPDSTFDNDGVVSGFGHDAALNANTEIAILADGKILTAGGYNFDGRTRIHLVRYNADGRRDPDFANSYDDVNPWEYNYVEDMVIQPDGKIVIGVRTKGRQQTAYTYDNFLVRYSSNGWFDEDFGIGGIAATDIRHNDFHTNNWVSALALQEDGQILALGLVVDSTFQKYQWSFFRYDSIGVVSDSFITSTFHHGTSCPRVGFMALQPDGKVIIFGNGENGNRPCNFALSRYNLIYIPSDTIPTDTISLDTIPPDNSPQPFSLYPNPTASSATLKFTLEKSGPITLHLVDLTGRRIQTLLPSMPHDEGVVEIPFEIPTPFQSGIYFLQLITPDGRMGTKIVVK